MSVAAERATISREVWGRNGWSGGHGGGDNITPSPPCTQCPPHLLQHLLQRGHRLLLAASRLERGTGWGTAPERRRSLPTSPGGPDLPRPGCPPRGAGRRERQMEDSPTSACSASWYRWGGKRRVSAAAGEGGGSAGAPCPQPRWQSPPGPQRVPVSPSTCSTLLCTTVPMALEQRRGVRPLKSPALPSTFTMCLAGDSGDPSPPGTPHGGQRDTGTPHGGDRLTVREEAGQLVDLAPENVPAQGGRQRLVAHLRRGQAAGTGAGVAPPRLPAARRPLPAPAPSRT